MSWLAALGTIMSALMSSSPTTRIATTTVVAVRTASTMLSGSTGMPTARAYSSSLATAKSRGRSAQVVTAMSDGEPGEDVEVGALRREDRAEEVLHEVRRRAVGRLADDDDAGGDAAVEDDGEGHVAVRAARGCGAAR